MGWRGGGGGKKESAGVSSYSESESETRVGGGGGVGILWHGLERENVRVKTAGYTEEVVVFCCTWERRGAGEYGWRIFLTWRWGPEEPVTRKGCRRMCLVPWDLIKTFSPGEKRWAGGGCCGFGLGGWGGGGGGMGSSVAASLEKWDSAAVRPLFRIRWFRFRVALASCTGESGCPSGESFRISFSRSWMALST